MPFRDLDTRNIGNGIGIGVLDDVYRSARAAATDAIGYDNGGDDCGYRKPIDLHDSLSLGCDRIGNERR